MLLVCVYILGQMKLAFQKTLILTLGGKMGILRNCTEPEISAANPPNQIVAELNLRNIF